MANLRTMGRLLSLRTTAEMRDFAAAHGLLSQGKIDLEGSKLRFNHNRLSLSAFSLRGADLSGSNLINCDGRNADLTACKLVNVRIVVEKGSKASFTGASFDDCFIEKATFGPRTLDLSQTTFRNSELVDVQFTMGNLVEADFSGATLKRVNFRNAVLKNGKFPNTCWMDCCLEKADLVGADFSGATMTGMQDCGEPNFAGAIISDALRYQFAIVKQPKEQLVELLASGRLDPGLDQAAQRMLERLDGFVPNRADAMLIADEYRDVMTYPVFVQLVKLLKNAH